jgi:hypothetical protein
VGVTVLFLIIGITGFGGGAYIYRIAETLNAGGHPSPVSGRPGEPVIYRRIGGGLPGPAPGMRYYTRGEAPMIIDAPQAMMSIPFKYS